MREADALAKLLGAHEHVSYLIGGRYGKSQGILVLTETRLMFVNVGLFSAQTEDFGLDKVSSIEIKSKLLLGDITVYTSNQKATINNVDKFVGAEFVKQARSALGGSKRPVAAPTEGTADQLLKLKQLHEAGVLTDAEYETKRATLVAQL